MRATSKTKKQTDGTMIPHFLLLVVVVVVVFGSPAVPFFIAHSLLCMAWHCAYYILSASSLGVFLCVVVLFLVVHFGLMGVGAEGGRTRAPDGKRGILLLLLLLLDIHRAMV